MPEQASLDSLRALMAQAAEGAKGGTPPQKATTPSEEQARKWVVAATSRRPLSERETEDKLTAWLEKRERDTTIVPSVMAWARSQGLVDDQAFAKVWVANRGVKRGYGRKRLTQELRKRQIAPHHIDAALTQLDEVDEYAQARELAGERFMRYPASEDPRRVAMKLVNFLMRRGFDASIAHQAAISVTRADEHWD
ncbi:regulatory protein RecX [Stomatohabitans albus]|uniref:regulatory protein RecX n=1 Tax=Stomatohabitans albus TaxID=3110766 RepID=UPI00300DB880